MSSENDFLETEYLEIESLEWLENIPEDCENVFIITSGQ